MIIKSIAAENFQCYSGCLNQNRFDFRKGLNVIIGDNGSGKSKLYDAFFWVLYDKIFDSLTRKLVSTSDVNIGLISDKAKAECLVGEKITVKVQLILQHYKTDTTYPEEYLLERSYTIQKVKEVEDYNSLEAWKLPPGSNKLVEKKDILDFKPLPGVHAFENVVQMLIPTDMSQYLWFQGEQVDSLIDFKSESSLTQAINILSDISYYDTIIEVANKVYKQAENAYKNELKEKSENEGLSRQHVERHSFLEKAIEKDEENLAKINENLQIAEDYKDDLLAKIKDAQEMEKLKTELKHSREKVNHIKEKLETARKGFNNNLFKHQWILRNGEPYFKKYENLLKDYESHREDLKMDLKIKQQQENARKNRLPENVPNATYLNEMIKEMHCFLCDRGFGENDHAHNFLQELLEKTKKTRVSISDVVKHDLKPSFQQLYNNAYNLKVNAINRIDESITQELEKIEELEAQQKTAIQNHEFLDQKLQQLIGTSSIDENKSREIVRDFQQYDRDKSKFQGQKFEITQRLTNHKEELKNVLDKMKQNVSEPINQEIIEKKETLELFLELAKSTREMVYEEQIRRIEEEANKHFQQMTMNNRSVQGRIILKKHGNNYMPKNVDENGIELTSPNDSNIILIKLSTILAIVTAKGKSEFHPLISDAPTSKFSDNYTLGFCDTIDDVFTQSIIFSYDFFHNLPLRKRLLSEVNNLGAVFLIEPSIKDVDRTNRKKLATQITPLN